MDPIGLKLSFDARPTVRRARLAMVRLDALSQLQI
jgi:hypothetical protein